MLIHGASSGVGSAMLQLAKLAGVAGFFSSGSLDAKGRLLVSLSPLDS
jgi:NADPH:quinone reductase-like Zn-dependent oxidoreductase